MPKISELTPAASLTGTESVPITQSGDTVRTSVAALSSAAIASEPTVSALAATDWSENAVPIGTGANTLAQVPFAINTFPARASTGALSAKPISDFGLSLVDDADAAAARNTLGAQASDATLTALASANWSANSLPIGSGADTVAQVTFAANTFPARSSTGNLVAKPITDFALTFLDDADAATVRTTIGAQPLDATLTALSGQNWVANAIPLGSGADTVSQLTLGANTIPGRSSAGNVVAKPVSDTAFTALSQAMYGTYTPTITNGTNVAAATPNVHTWMRVGNTVTVSGHTSVDPTLAAATATDFSVSLPVASNFANASDCAGGGFNGEAPYSPVGIFADVANDRATVVFYSNSTSLRTVGYSFTYQVI